MTSLECYESLDVGDLRAVLEQVVDRASRASERVVITRNGVPVAAIVAVEDLEWIERSELEEDEKLLSDALSTDSEDGIPLQELLAEPSDDGASPDRWRGSTKPAP